MPLFEQRRIDIPAKGTAGKLARTFRRQPVNFADEPVASRRKANPADPAMAAWFPVSEMLKILQRGLNDEVTLEVARESSYPQYGGGQVPWGTTQYPGSTRYVGE